MRRKPCLADLAFADVLVPVEVGAERRLGVVGVDDVCTMVEAQDAFGLAHGGAKTGCGGDVEAGGEQMAGVQAVADGEVGDSRREVADGLRSSSKRLPI